MSLFTSILKGIAEETIHKTSAVPTCLNKLWFSYILKVATKEHNRGLERFKREPTEGNLNVYLNARAKARRDIRHSKKTYLRWILKHRLNLYGIGSAKSRERNPLILFVIWLSMLEMSRLTVTLLMHWQITFLLILPLLSSHLYVKKLKGRILTFHLKMLKYTTGHSLLELQDALRRAHATSAGPDEIHYQLLKHLPKSSLILL